MITIAKIDIFVRMAKWVLLLLTKQPNLLSSDKLAACQQFAHKKSHLILIGGFFDIKTACWELENILSAFVLRQRL